jgi:hypothetical protein
MVNIRTLRRSLHPPLLSRTGAKGGLRLWDKRQEREDTVPTAVANGTTAIDVLRALPEGGLNASMRIPTQSGHRFRFDAGRRSDLKPATIPK